MTTENPKPKPPTSTTATPHILHVTERGMHLHWAPMSSRDAIESAGIAARAFAGPDLHRAASDPVPVRHPLGMFRFGVDEDGNAIIGGRVASA